MIVTNEDLQDFLDRCMLMDIEPSFDEFDSVKYNFHVSTQYLITRWKADSEVVIIPEFTFGIAEEAFQGENAQSIRQIDLSYARHIKNLPAGVFKGLKNLESVIFHDQIESIGENTFKDCVKLKEFIAPPKLKTLNGSCFRGCTSMDTVVLNEGLKLIGVQAFMGTGISEIRIPNSVTGVHSRSFCDCPNLKLVVFGDNSESQTRNINGGVFEYCTALEEVNMSNMQYQGLGKDYLFYGCNKLKTVKLPKHGLKVGNFAFGHCNSLIDMDASQIETTSYTDYDFLKSLGYQGEKK